MHVGIPLSSYHLIGYLAVSLTDAFCNRNPNLFLFVRIPSDLRRDTLVRALGMRSVICVMAIFWARVSCRLALKDACFRMRITLGVVLIRSLVCAICVPGRLRSGPELASSWESRRDVITPLIRGFLSKQTLETTSMWLFPQFPQKLELRSLLVIWEHSSFVPNCS